MKIGVSLLALFRSFEQTGISIAIRRSKWGFAAIEMIHLIALALFGASILVLALRTLGALMRDQPLARVSRSLAPWWVAGFGTMLCSGVLLVADGPLRYYANAAFRTKMALIGAAFLCSGVWYRAALRASAPGPASIGLRTAAALSLALWLAVGLAGRLIGVL